MSESVLASALTVDVEDYFQVSAFEHRICRSDWESMQCRVEESTDRLLALFDSVDVRATFFILGWVAQRYPGLVGRIASAGHELGSHGYWHRLVYDTSPAEFREDVRRSRDVIEQASGIRVRAYRAPSFSINGRSLWALDVLAELGFTVDSSIFPIRHDRYGMPDARPEPHEIKTDFGFITEFPPSVWSVGRFNLPIAGGGYFRLYPLSVTLRGIASVAATGRPFMFYLHPWEIDADQPRVANIGWKSRFRHYVGLRGTEAKLRCLLRSVRFDTMTATLAAYQKNNVAQFTEQAANSIKLLPR